MNISLSPPDILVHPRTAREYSLIISYLRRTKLLSRELSRWETEDIGLSEMAKNIDRSDQISTEELLATLK
jgi:hypothetical protein